MTSSNTGPLLLALISMLKLILLLIPILILILVLAPMFLLRIEWASRIILVSVDDPPTEQELRMESGERYSSTKDAS